MTDQFLGLIAVWLKEWGPGLLIALVMLFGLYKLLLKLGEKVSGF